MSWLTNLPTLLSRLDALSALLSEHNGLLREGLIASGHRPQTPAAEPQRSRQFPQSRIRTDKDVTIVSRQDRQVMAEEEARANAQLRPPKDPTPNLPSSVAPGVPRTPIA